MKKLFTSPSKTTLLAPLAAGLVAFGCVLCGNETQAQPSISGISLPGAPNNANGYGVGALQLQGAAPSPNQLAFSVNSVTGVTELTAQVTGATLPGTGTSTLLTPGAGLTVIGASTSENVTLPLANDTIYNIVITATDSSGSASSTLSFDTINPDYFTFEAEDFDYNGGQYYDSLPPGTFNSLDFYSTLPATVGIDCNNHTGGQAAYRPNPLETETPPGDVPRMQYATSGYPDFDVGFNSGGDWGNYTRHYPEGVYNIYLRGSGGNGPQANACTIGLVTSGYDTTNQTTNHIGAFSVKGIAWSTYTWCPAVDTNGYLAAWVAGGDLETLRFTVANGNCNENFYMLVPAAPNIVQNTTNIYQGSPCTLTFAPYGLTTPTIQWQSDNGTGGVTWSSISGATSTNYSVPSSSLAVKSYEYQVLVTTASNSIPETVTSAVVAISILTPSKPVIVGDTYPSSTTAALGTASSFSASFTGPGPITYQWLVSSNLGSTFTAISGQTNGSITILNLSLFTNEYELQASNSIGTTVSTPATLTTVPAPPPPPLQLAGDLVAELRSADLAVGGNAWTNRAGSSASVGNFQTVTAGTLTVSNNTINPGTPLWGADTVNALYVNSVGTALQSALVAPAEISTNGTSSGEAWIYATAISGNNTVIGYGLQGQSAHPEQDREMNWGNGSGCFSGDFGSLDCEWTSPYPATGTWFYLAWTWDGTNAIGYVNGVQNVYHTLSSSSTFGGYPLETADTLIGVGAALGGGPNIGVDSFGGGWIASVRVSSGVLTASQISNNFNSGLLAKTPITVYPPTASPSNIVTVGSSVTLNGQFATNVNLTYTYQWQWDSGSGGATWTPISDATNLSYAVNTTGLTIGTYEYELVLSNSADDIVVTSSPILVLVQPATAPEIVQDVTPSSLTQYVTQTGTLSASISGEAPLTLEWQVSSNDATWTATGVSTTSIAIESEVPVTNWYRLWASNALGTNISSTAEVTVLPALELPPYTPLQTAGDLIVNLQQTDLSASYTVWTNVTSSTNGVGNFSGALIGGSNLNVTTGAAYLYNRVKSLFINQEVVNGLQSALLAPNEIIANNPVSAEAWVYATAVNEQNSCAIAYGDQGQNSPPQTDREFNYCTSGGGAVSGDFGSYDMPWASGSTTTGVWHYLAWTYDGSTVACYQDGTNNNANTPSAPNVTPGTVICIGGGIGQQLSGDPNLSLDSFQGYIGAARVESGVLTADQIATNYIAGLMGVVPVVLWAPSVTPSAPGDIVYQGNTISLGLVAKETTSFSYQWLTDNGSHGSTWTAAAGTSTGSNYVLNVSSLSPGTYEYEIMLTNSTYGLVFTSPPVALTVDAAAAPTVEQQPTPASTNAYVGQTVTFTAAYTGNQPITNQWQFSASGSTYTNISGATNSTLTLSGLQLSQSGSYRLTATNSVGSGAPTSASTLTVSEPPSVSFSFSAGSLSLTWAAGGTLVESTSLSGPWTTVTATSPYLVTPSSFGEGMFFKVNYGQ
jgi:hypothetical protein